MDDAASGEDRDIGGPAADVDHDNAALELVLADHRLGGGEHLEDQVVDVQARLVDHLDDVLDRGLGPGHDVSVDLETASSHAHGVAHPVLAVDGELLGQDMEDPPIAGDRDRPGGVDGPPHILGADLAPAGGHRDDAAAVLGRDVAAGEPDHGGIDGHPGHLLGEVHRLGHRLGGAVDLDDRALADPPGDGLADSQDAQTRRFDVGDGAADLGGTQIKCEDVAKTAHIGTGV